MDAGRTRERLLDAAERLLAAKGFEATSVRDVTAKAKANLAAVNYHFGSKEALVRAVFERRLGEVNRKRLALLHGTGRRPAPERILHAFIAPTFELMKEAPHFIQLMGRFHAEPDSDMHDFVTSRCREVAEQFKRALTAALPRVPVEDLFWRMHFVMGALVHTWSCHRDLERISGGRCSMKDDGEITRKLIAFGVAGLRAPARPRAPEVSLRAAAGR
ncbi:MAG TPA: TetR family transcriptional regulator [Planctomycetota bacterium]|nr:TetR family transcriptional regulator [Planctomycetota bacterium]